MPTKQEMLDLINSKIAIWEIVKSNQYSSRRTTRVDIIEYTCCICNWEYKAWHTCERMLYNKVMIWDVLDYMEKWPNFFDEIIPVVDLWINLRRPIDEQPIKCIEYVYNLCK